MLEFHGWMTIRETYEANDDDEIDTILQKVQELIQSLKWNRIDLKARNGECYIEASIYANRKTDEMVELLNFFKSVAALAVGSYGIIYIMDDEDTNGNENEFQVYSVSRGELHKQKDIYLSPFVPVVEDAYNQ